MEEVYTDGSYSVMKVGKSIFKVFCCSSQIGYSHKTLEEAKQAIEKDKERCKAKAAQRSTWKLRKQLDPNNPSHVRLAERNGLYLTASAPVYEYADPEGFLHYTRRLIQEA